MIVLTTSRNPAPGIRSFTRDLSHILSATVLTRGKTNLRGLDAAVRELNAEKLILVSRGPSGPGRLEFKKLHRGHLTSVPPTILLSTVRLRREYNVHGRFKVDSVTCQDSEDLMLKRFTIALSEFLNIPLAEEARGSKASLHVAKTPSHRIFVTVMDHDGKREVGPSFIIHHLIWETER